MFMIVFSISVIFSRTTSFDENLAHGLAHDIASAAVTIHEISFVIGTSP
jgi:hypothetical protein